MRISILNLLLLVAVLALSMIIFAERCLNTDSVFIRDQFGYSHFEISKSLFDHRTRWNASTTNPPLDIARVKKLCGEIIQDISNTKLPASLEWSHESTSLIALDENLGQWCYLVAFEGYPKNIGFNGPPATFSALILFDETVVIHRGNNYVDDDPNVLAMMQANYMITP